MSEPRTWMSSIGIRSFGRAQPGFESSRSRYSPTDARRLGSSARRMTTTSSSSAYIRSTASARRPASATSTSADRIFRIGNEILTDFHDVVLLGALAEDEEPSVYRIAGTESRFFVGHAAIVDVDTAAANQAGGLALRGCQPAGCEQFHHGNALASQLVRRHSR